jgi:hypothetical protein
MNFLKRIFGRRCCSINRVSWWTRYGRFADPVSSVWLDRDLEHNEKQAMRDASQSVMTRLV